MIVRLYGHGPTLCKSMAVWLYIMQIHGCTAVGMDLHYVSPWLYIMQIYGCTAVGMDLHYVNALLYGCTLCKSMAVRLLTWTYIV